MTSASASFALSDATLLAPLHPAPHMHRRLLIVIAVIGFHVLALWALQMGLLRRAVEWVVPVTVLSEVIESPQPQVALTPSPPQPRPAPSPQATRPPTPAVQLQTKPVAEPTVQPVPVPQAPAAVIDTPPAAPVTAVTAVATAPPTLPAAPVPAKVELPSSSADYLNNPPPPYPPLSKRLGEQGKVVVRAFIDEKGNATKAEIRSSSGYDRLDQAALQTVLRWRYVPGKRAGIAEGMWFNVPINFVLE